MADKQIEFEEYEWEPGHQRAFRQVCVVASTEHVEVFAMKFMPFSAIAARDTSDENYMWTFWFGVTDLTPENFESVIPEMRAGAEYVKKLRQEYSERDFNVASNP
ncbi:hypothetical protein GF380_06655 [Candidatus Uhrbacteria bacterium]|nr:hypothetical protein [Candidatus Uhrbacteria bacterium]